ncbi:autotransporter family protein [Pseudomonas poae]|uniref:Autotransporter outer membrane beta-barrel domain-containing protein n=1 Tax=Pseudomonas poae TaxID=200451 RepID=A0A2S9E8T9_9PSED|nr:autotransporter outer membrane beta-barrel domain-containing protein [Pseudomonas poae]PRA27854.1 autotransporter outer membrane beta-barrel domain-containing protein [Pseudomonas poae]PRC11227.1 autotransporter outer membrane beta-barrel domain-containing protein [Pseudomonas poae]
MKTLTHRGLYLGLIAAAAWSGGADACPLTVTAGDDVITCTSDAAGSLTDLQGNNSLIFPTGSTGSVLGVTYGAGNDLIELNAAGASIGTGGVSMGDGANIFRLFNGQVNGAILQGAGADVVQISGGQAGGISQGAGADSFAMSGGTIASLAQGDGIDNFNMSGGTITGAFEDGDLAKMTGGSIGRVDMKLDNNVFDMQGGTIVGNLVTGFGNDTILVSGTSYIGGNISTSGGVDIITVTGGTVNGQILASAGNDIFSWIGGGRINGSILMGADNDAALLQNLTETIVSSTALIDGGLGVDTLTIENSHVGTPGRYTNWEHVILENAAQFDLGGTFILGDSGTGTGTMTIGGGSRLLVNTGVISAYLPGQWVTLNNNGLIDMTTGSSIATDALTVNGNYIGNGGQLALDTVLGSDGSASDKLVISQGTIQGTTSIRITNLGGSGAATAQDGIQVVQAVNGATGGPSSFSLAGRVSAGAFDYYLYKGGVSAGTSENFYLRSTVPVTPLPGVEDPIEILPVPGEEPPPPRPTPGDRPIPIYRPEVPIYAALFPAAQQIVQGMLGTYHERMGDQSQPLQVGAFPAGWGRVYGSSSRQSFAGTVSPTLNSSVTGFQVGSDVYADTTASGLMRRLGFFVGHSTLKGDVKGFNGGWQDKDAGNTTLRGDSLGVYWTLIGANQAYLDLVLMGTRFNGNNESDRGGKMKTQGHNVTASAEVGWPLPLSENWVVEPQAQVIVGRTKLDRQNDGISDVSFDADTNVTTRLGARLRGNYQVNGMPVQPYVRANVWHASAGTNTVTFNGVTDIDTEQKSTTLDVNLGATLQIAKGVGVYAEVGYNRNLDSNAFNGREGTVGLRMEF